MEVSGAEGADRIAPFLAGGWEGHPEAEDYPRAETVSRVACCSVVKVLSPQGPVKSTCSSDPSRQQPGDRAELTPQGPEHRGRHVDRDPLLACYLTQTRAQHCAGREVSAGRDKAVPMFFPEILICLNCMEPDAMACLPGPT